MSEHTEDAREDQHPDTAQHPTSADVSNGILSSMQDMSFQEDQDSYSSEYCGEPMKYIKELCLEPYPHGCNGYFKEVHRSSLKVGSTEHDGDRSAVTSIHTLLAGKDFSPWHTVKSDEIYIYQAGGPLVIHTIRTDGNYSCVIIGNPLVTDGAVFQHTIARNAYFATELLDKSTYSLSTIIVAPGWCIEDFRICDVEFLVDKFSQHKSIIEKFSPKSPSAEKLSEAKLQEVIALIEKFGLRKHPMENGWFAETFESSITMYSSSHGYSERSPLSAIYYLLAAKDFNPWHRMMGSDEVWSHHLGGILQIHMISPKGAYSMKILGNPFDVDEAQPQCVVPAGHWFAMEMRDKDDYCLVSEAMGPGFHNHDFQMYTRDTLLQLFPQHKDILEKFASDITVNILGGGIPNG